MALGWLLLVAPAVQPTSGCRRETAPRLIYTPAAAEQLLGAYEFWSPRPADVDEALAAVDTAIAADARLQSVRTARFALAVVGRVEGGVRFIDIYGEKDWAKAGMPSPATLVVGYSPTHLRAVYNVNTRQVVQLTAPHRGR